MLLRSVLCLCVIGVIVSHPIAFSQEFFQAESTLDRALQNSAQGKPLAAIELIESDRASAEMEKQILGTLYSFVGDVEKARNLQGVAQKNSLVTPPPDAVYRDAIDAIVDIARNRQIVMINESHDSPHHREFILQLARKLHDLGFDHYAMETLDEDPLTLSLRGYPTLSSGFYSAEPIYGDLVREALKLGYVPVAYEARSEEQLSNPIDDINAREQAQCSNLVEKVISKNANAKLLVHVGFDHVKKSSVKARDKEIQWLAKRLKDATGIEPLCIDQTTELSAETKWPQEFLGPVVASDKAGRAIINGHFKDNVDFQVFHPRPTFRDGRPEWLFRTGERIAFEIPQEIEIASGRYLIQVRQVNESSDAVPNDQIILEAGKPRPILALRPGKYRINVQDNKGDKTYESIMSVAGSGKQ